MLLGVVLLEIAQEQIEIVILRILGFRRVFPYIKLVFRWGNGSGPLDINRGSSHMFEERECR